MSDYAWPGNVRELRNVMERAAVLLDGDRVDRDLVRELLPNARPTVSAPSGQCCWNPFKRPEPSPLHLQVGHDKEDLVLAPFLQVARIVRSRGRARIFPGPPRSSDPPGTAAMVCVAVLISRDTKIGPGHSFLFENNIIHSIQR